MKFVLAAAGAALVIAVANPAFACGGGGYAYRAPHQVKAAAAPAIAKSAIPARSPRRFGGRFESGAALIRESLTVVRVLTADHKD